MRVDSCWRCTSPAALCASQQRPEGRSCPDSPAQAPLGCTDQDSTLQCMQWSSLAQHPRAQRLACPAMLPAPPPGLLQLPPSASPDAPARSSARQLGNAPATGTFHTGLHVPGQSPLFAGVPACMHSAFGNLTYATCYRFVCPLGQGELPWRRRPHVAAAGHAPARHQPCTPTPQPSSDRITPVARAGRPAAIHSCSASHATQRSCSHLPKSARVAP